MNAYLPKLTRCILLLVTLIVFVNKARAQSIGNLSVRSKLDGAAGQLVKDSMIMSQDSIYFNSTLLAKLDTPYHVRNLINFSINEYSNVYLADSFTATIQLRIYYLRPDQAMDSVDQTLQINYDTAHAYTQRSSFVFNDAHQVSVKVLSIDAPEKVIPALQVENEIRMYPIYKLSCTDDAVKAVYNNNPANTDSTDEILVNWPVVIGVNEFDLEWTYIDSTALLSGRYGSPGSPDANLLFKDNSTRVTVASNSYAIPLMYDDGGVLFYRVRGVQESAANYDRLETAWSSDYSGGLGSYHFCGHQRALNWQSNISYAEDGKRKVVVQYFDGSLRSRQTVTKDNTTNTTLVAESMYDYQGRPVIQVLPSPTLSTAIKYSANFNRGLNSAEYDKDQYDHIDDPADLLTVHATPMDSSSGTNQYYSLNNPQKDVGANRFIPQANGYAFTETEYTPDNTGRISRQGGVGKTFQLGSGHETKYYYGATPSENDLYALFGTEVGDKSHYFKNMVVDANGQASISYVDMHGRTVATALAGTATNASITDVSDKDSLVVTDALVNVGTNQVQGNALVAVQDKMVPQDGVYSFNYTLAPPVLNMKDCNGNTVCYTSLYDLEIKITDEANNQHLGGHPFDTILHNYVVGGIIPDCSQPAPVTVSFDMSLPQGVYTVTKILTVSPQAMAFYRDSIFAKVNHCVTMEEMIQQQRALQLQAQCIPDCQTCRDSLGTWDQFRVSYTRRAGGDIADTASYRNDAWVAYNAAMAECDNLCGANTESQQLRSAMLQDMTAPSGQYATLSDSADVYSIYYHPSEDVPATYRRDDITYLNDFGQPDMVYDENTNTYVKPQKLPQDVFAAKFKASWAEALLRFHPEGCKLAAFEAYNDSQHWDKDFEATDTYTDALQKGYLNPTGLTGFAYPSVPAYKDSLVIGHPELVARLNATIQSYQEGFSIWSLAAIETKCDGKDAPCKVQYDTPQKAFAGSGMCGGDLDMAWRNFRTTYLLIKHDLINNTVDKVTNCNGQLNISSDVLLQLKKQPRFMTSGAALDQAGLSSYLKNQQTEDGAKALGKSLTAQVYDDNCRQYALAWVQQLAPCKYDTTVLNNIIIPELIKVCKAGSDVDHPNGSSSVPPGSSAVYKSFEDVLRAYNAARGITDPLVCNAQLITAPQPYDKQTPTVEAVTYNRPSDCQCDKLHLLVTEYDSAKTGTDINLAAYLARTRGTTISQSELDVLLDACSAGPGSCTFLSKAISIPVFMQCNSTAASCATCTDVSGTYAAFKATYPGILPAKGDVDSVQQLKNNLFASYMNSHLGFGKLAWEYLDYMDSCAAGTNRGGPVHSICKTVTNKYITWTLSDTKTSAFADLKRTADGYIMAGWSTGFGQGGKDAYLAKVDMNGNLVWAKSFGGAADDNFNRIIATSDSGYVVIGTTASNCEGQTTAMIVKVDSSGNEQWSRILDLNLDGSEGWDVIETSDQKYAFAAVRNNAQTNTNTDWITGVFYPDGNLQWMRMIGTPEAKANGHLLQDDNALVLASGMTATGGSPVTSVLKVDRNTGDFMSLDKYTVESGGSAANDIIKTADGYRLSVAAGQHGDLLDITKDGSVTVAKKYDSNGGVMKTWSSAPLPDGGTVASFTVGSNVYWMTLNTDQSVNWTNEERMSLPHIVNKVIANTDGTFAGAGQGSTDAMLMKPTLNGRTGCNDTNVVVIATDVSAAVTRQSVGTFTDAILSSNNVNAIDIADASYDPPVAATICSGLDSCYLVGDGPMLCGAVEPAFAAISPNDLTSCSDSTFFAVSAGTVRYQTYTDSLNNVFEHDYMQKALNAGTAEQFTVSFKEVEYHYTLYYYDQAGNLVKTVPPAGAVVNRSDTWINQVKAAKTAGTNLPPLHNMPTQYRYNTLNTAVAQSTPDAGQNHFWYDRLGRIAVSQNAKQVLTNDYSYTSYDYLGRVTEVGQLHSPTAITDQISRNDVSLNTWLSNAASTKEQITLTSYDVPHTPLEDYVWNAQNLRNRVSWSAVYNTAAQLQSGYDRASATYYSYDVHGNVKELLQEFNSGIAGDNSTYGHYKKIAYNYDLISGKVNTVSFNPGQPDAFYHHYSYDAENRITDVETSRDSLFWEHDAYYQYYKHGPLARTVLGQQQVQGLDYAYSLQGWIKGVNGTSLDGTFEMGGDGTTTAKDAFGYALHYYGPDDYKPIGTGVRPFAEAGGSTFKPLFNGNIGAMSVNLPKVGEPLQYNYRYDALNRILGMQTLRNLDQATNNWAPIAVDDFGESVQYDGNGNILGYHRNGNNTWAGKSLEMDRLKYYYVSGTNKLDHIVDSTDAGAYTEDLDTQDEGNYGYDAIGNLVKDQGSNIDEIKWTVYGKISDIHKTTDNGTTIHYTYDAGGNRISKTVNGVVTWYVRDATGNVMSIYTRGDNNVNGGHLTQTETDIYGSSRLGVEEHKVDLDQQPAAVPGGDGGTDSGFMFDMPRGEKVYELGNHLGNVLATVGDVKVPESTDNAIVSEYDPRVRSAQDYYPFGMQEPERVFSDASYRYGFNGKENDDDVKGSDGLQDYGMRSYDLKVGRFLSIDPLTQKYPWYTPYQFSGNKPIQFVDIDGKEEKWPKIYTDVLNTLTTARTIFENVKETSAAIGNLVDFVKTTEVQRYMHLEGKYKIGARAVYEFKNAIGIDIDLGSLELLSVSVDYNFDTKKWSGNFNYLDKNGIITGTQGVSFSGPIGALMGLPVGVGGSVGKEYKKDMKNNTVTTTTTVETGTAVGIVNVNNSYEKQADTNGNENETVKGTVGVGQAAGVIMTGEYRIDMGIKIVHTK